MKLIDIVIQSSSLSINSDYELIFQGKHSSGVLSSSNNSPGAVVQQVPCSNLKEGKEILEITLKIFQNNTEVIAGSVIESIQPTKESSTITITFSKSEGHAIDATVSLSYKMTSSSILETLQKSNGQGFGWNICVSYLSHEDILDENQCILKIKLIDEKSYKTLASGKISSRSISYFIPYDHKGDIDEDLTTRSVLMEVYRSDDTMEMIASLPVRDLGPNVYSLAIDNNIIAMIAIQSIPSTEFISTIIHDVSLSTIPTRGGGGGSKSSEPNISANQLLLYVDDMASHTKSSDIINGILSSSFIPTVVSGPNTGTYIMAGNSLKSSKSMKTTRDVRQLQATHIGFMALHASNIKSRLKLKVSLLALQFQMKSTTENIAKKHLVEEIQGHISQYLGEEIDNQKYELENKLQILSSVFMNEVSREISESGSIFLSFEGTFTINNNDSMPSTQIVTRLHLTIATPIDPALTLTSDSTQSKSIEKEEPTIVNPPVMMATKPAATSQQDNMIKDEGDQSGFFSEPNRADYSFDQLPGKSTFDLPLEQKKLLPPNKSQLTDSTQAMDSVVNPEFVPEMSSNQNILQQNLSPAEGLISDIEGINGNNPEIVSSGLVEEDSYSHEVLETMIARLKEEVDEKKQAIESCAEDMRLLRQVNDDLKKRLQKAEETIESLQTQQSQAVATTERLLMKKTSSSRAAPSTSITTAPSSSSSSSSSIQTERKLEDLDKATLELVVVEICSQYQQLEAQNIILEGNLNQSKVTEKDFEELRQRHDLLIQAHQEQMMLLQEKMEEMKNISKYKQTIITQEKIIQKLQSIFENKLKKKSSQVKSSPHSLSHDSYSVLNSTSMSAFPPEGSLYHPSMMMESQGMLPSVSTVLPTAANQSNWSSSSSAAAAAAAAVPNDRIYQLEADISAKEIHITALEEQLAASAKEHSYELSRLRTKMLEMEIQAAIAGATLDSNHDVGRENEVDYSDQKTDFGLKLPSGTGLNAVNAIRKSINET